MRFKVCLDLKYGNQRVTFYLNDGAKCKNNAGKMFASSIIRFYIKQDFLHYLFMLMFSQLPVSVLFLYCIAIAFLLIYVPFLVVAYARVSIGYDYYAPRTMFEKLPAYAQRATWAHQNSFETFPIFAAAALMAYVTGVNSSLAAWAALSFITARLLYSVFYISNIPLLRSLMYAIGLGCSCTLFVLSIIQASS